MAKKRRTDGYGGRIAKAMRDGPRPADSVRGLARRIRERPEYKDLRGATYGGIRQYVEQNVARPRVELLRALADVLEVRPDWLAFDDGAMTEEEERTGEAAMALWRADAGDPDQFTVGPQPPGGPRWPFDYHEVARFALTRLWKELTDLEGGMDGRIVEEGIGAGTMTRSGQLFAEIQVAVMGPIRALGLDDPGERDDAFNDYAVSVAQALRQYAHARAPGTQEDTDG